MKLVFAVFVLIEAGVGGSQPTWLALGDQMTVTVFDDSYRHRVKYQLNTGSQITWKYLDGVDGYSVTLPDINDLDYKIEQSDGSFVEVPTMCIADGGFRMEGVKGKSSGTVRWTDRLWIGNRASSDNEFVDKLLFVGQIGLAPDSHILNEYSVVFASSGEGKLIAGFSNLVVNKQCSRVELLGQHQVVSWNFLVTLTVGTQEFPIAVYRLETIFDYIEVPENTWNVFTSSLIAAGMRIVQETTEGIVIGSCTEERALTGLSTIALSFGGRKRGATTVTLRPRDYLEFREDMRCVAKILPQKRGSQRPLLMGSILFKVASVALGKSAKTNEPTLSVC